MSENNILGTDKRIKLGIWGLGRGARFIETAKALGIDIVAGCDFNPIMQERLKEACPDVFVTADEDEFLAQDMDAVLIATFFQSHADHSIKAMAAGKHVLCEVTSFYTPAEGVRLVEAVEKYGKIYNLAENYPFMKNGLYVKDLWDKGFFGDLMYSEFQYVHDVRKLAYTYINGVPIEPAYQLHTWRSWLNFHYYNTHSLGPLMHITNTRPVMVSAPPSTVHMPGMPCTMGEEKYGSVSVSMIQMSNGGIMRNLMGTISHDIYHGRIWGTRAFVDLANNQIALGAQGHSQLLSFTPEWPFMGEIASKAGHGGGDFWELYYFARQILTGEKAPWDIYSASDVTIAGIMAVKSQLNGGIPVEVPDFRDKAVREKYRNDHFQQEHFDPANIFPEGHDTLITGNYCKLMKDLDTSLVRTVFDGMKIYKTLSTANDREYILKRAHELIGKLPEQAEIYTALQKIADSYPDTVAAKAINSYIVEGYPEKVLNPEAARAEIQSWILENI